jgi:hypothetical protein
MKIGIMITALSLLYSVNIFAGSVKTNIKNLSKVCEVHSTQNYQTGRCYKRGIPYALNDNVSSVQMLNESCFAMDAHRKHDPYEATLLCYGQMNGLLEYRSVERAFDKCNAISSLNSVAKVIKCAYTELKLYY